MQIGVMSRTFSRPTLEEELDAVVSHGMHCMQFDLSSAGRVRIADGIEADLCDRIRTELASHNVTMVAINGLFNMIDPDVEKRRNGLERLRVVASACEALGTSVIALCTGSRNPRSMWLSHPDNNTPEAWNDLIDCMTQAVQIADEHNVTLAFEPEVSNVVDSARKARRLLDEVASPRLRVVMDAANIFHTGELPKMREILDEAFQLLGEDISFAHAKDLDHDGEAGHLAAGTGLLDYQQYLSLLNEFVPNVPLILHGLSEQQVAGCVSFLQGE
ncbi:MAG: sugar phosphate isomerase/epimerase family protein [Pseudomonadales bacterium]|nr:sugar phosphate isomerase/epimerase family protein [Pseudomonadales bacterium]